MRRSTYIVMAVVLGLFLISWVVKALSFQPDTDHYIIRGFLITFSAFLTLAVLSFLYRDNPFYKFAEHLFVGISAAFWMCVGFWTTIVQNLIPRISEGLSGFFKVPYLPGTYNFFFFIPVILGILLLMRLSPKGGWISRWPLAFIVGTTAGLNFSRYLRTDFIKQISSTFVPLLGREWQGVGVFFSTLDLSATGQFVMIAANWVIFLGVFCGLIYFYFSREHSGLFGRASRVGVWILMITFGASFGYTVMGRISLLVGRITFLFRDWLGLIS
ncbi:MAG TPA: hypothetical protein VMY05_08460 [Acidobacteriota bacterium]|nr:hypothetical protein [Acidobacteriota bacterium]